MRYNFNMSSSGFDPSYEPAKTTEDLKADAMRALTAWQGRLKKDQDAEQTLNTLLADLASKIKDKEESAKIDKAIRAEWLEKNKAKL